MSKKRLVSKEIIKYRNAKIKLHKDGNFPVMIYFNGRVHYYYEGSFYKYAGSKFYARKKGKPVTIKPYGFPVWIPE